MLETCNKTSILITINNTEDAVESVMLIVFGYFYPRKYVLGSSTGVDFKIQGGYQKTM